MVGDAPAGAIVALDLSPVTSTPLLVAFVGGSLARSLERLGERQMVQAVTSRLARGFGARLASQRTGGRRPGRPTHGLAGATRCSRQALTPEDRERLAEPVDRLVLAGEHVSVDRPSTMDGAWQSGRDAAERLLNALAS